jgi:hypothetical protein
LVPLQKKGESERERRREGEGDRKGGGREMGLEKKE